MLLRVLLLCLLPVLSPGQGIITTVAGGGLGGDGGLATDANLTQPNDVYVDDTGNIYIAQAHRLRKVYAATGIIHTIAGDGNPGFGCEGCPATQARFRGVAAMVMDTAGNIYVADKGNFCVRRIDAQTGLINTFAGKATWGYSGDGGPATDAELTHPTDLCFDTSGNLLIADEKYVIRRVDMQTGIISTVAGNGLQGSWSDGELAVDAQLGTIRGMCADKKGNIYFTDGNSRKIGKVDANGILTTYCGTGQWGTGGDGGLAINAETFASTKIRLDRRDNMFYGDGSIVVRRIDAATGIISRVAGNGSGGFSGDGGSALQAQLSGPFSVSLDTFNNLFIADQNNYRIRKVLNVTSVNDPVIYSVGLYPNPNNGQFTVDSDRGVDKVEIRDVAGQLVFRSHFKGTKAIVELDNTPDGVYTVAVYSNGEMTTKKFVLLR